MFKIKGKLAMIDSEKAERIIVVGDIHGDLLSFNFAKETFKPEKDLMIFLGDYADRGANSVEVIEGVKNLMNKYDKQVIALKGNHEDYSDLGKPKFYPCTLIEEVERKKGSWKLYFKNFKKDFLDKLYIAAKIPNLALFLHAGVSTKLRSEEDVVNPTKAIEEDLIWSDPYEGEGEYPNPRGAGVLYGRDVSKTVLERLNVRYLIRSHEPRKALRGPFIEHEGRVITISSTNVYGGKPFALVLPAKKPEKIERIGKYVQYVS